MVGTALTSYAERFKQDAKDIAAREARSGTMLSTKGGVFSLSGEAIGTKVAAVVLDSYFANEFYDPSVPYNADAPVSPLCYAFSRDKKAMAPHPSMQVDLTYFQPQHFQCDGCKSNEWGSALQGRGKACKNKERLVLLPAGYYTPARGRQPGELHLFDEAEHFGRADAVTLSLPVTSGEAWAKYVTQLAAAHQRPPYAVYTEIFLAPDPKTQYKVGFEFLDLLPETLFDSVVARVDAQLALPFTGFTPPDPTSRDQWGKPAPRTASQGLRR